MFALSKGAVLVAVTNTLTENNVGTKDLFGVQFQDTVHLPGEVKAVTQRQPPSKEGRE